MSATLKASQVKSMIETAYRAGKNLWIWGPPGIGKTDVVQWACKEADIPLILHPPAASLEAVDLRGIPYKDAKGKTRWAPPGFWPTDAEWRGIVFVDELSQGHADVQKGYMQAIQSKRIGDDLHISPGAVFVATGNRAEDRAGVSRILTPLLNRFTHCDMAVDLADWQAWAVGAGIHTHLRAFLNFRPTLLNTFDPKSQQRAFASPRSWANVSSLYKETLDAGRDDLLFASVAGTVGEGPAAELIAYVRVFSDLPDIDDALANPHSAPVPDASRPSAPGIFCALAASLAERLKGGKSSQATLENYGRYVLRWNSMEYQALAIRDGAAMDKRLIFNNKALDPWLLKNASLFGGTARR